jgi:DNA-directed RNA polymerase specialized sigma24 family protein
MSAFKIMNDDNYMDDSKTLKGIENKLSALIALMALSLSGKGKETKLEVLLKEAGLEVSEIAKVLGKKEQAVRKMIMRAR